MVISRALISDIAPRCVARAKRQSAVGIYVTDQPGNRTVEYDRNPVFSVTRLRTNKFRKAAHKTNRALQINFQLANLPF
ncbi:MAG: hypothetical protein ACREQC_04735, partial [Candidatus Binataceae bacterium]